MALLPILLFVFALAPYTVLSCDIVGCVEAIAKSPENAGNDLKTCIAAARGADHGQVKIGQFFECIAKAAKDAYSTIDACKDCGSNNWGECSYSPGIASSFNRHCGNDQKLIDSTGYAQCAQYNKI